ncbi:MAG: restriction endonuclease [Fimbriimonadaceae bacterium]|nr:restriction endonuclease [Fimbriimonadaceae bacterium]
MHSNRVAFNERAFSLRRDAADRGHDELARLSPTKKSQATVRKTIGRKGPLAQARSFSRLNFLHAVNQDRIRTVPTKKSTTKKTKAKSKVKPKPKAKPTKPAPKWQIVENVVAAIEMFYAKTSPSAKIIQKARLPQDDRPEQRREVDVLVVIPAGRRTARIGVDVKNEKAPLDVVVVEQLIGKYSKLRQSLDKYCIVSTSGFTQPALADAARAGVEALHLTESGVDADTAEWQLQPFQDQLSPQEILCWDDGTDGSAAKQLFQAFLTDGRLFRIGDRCQEIVVQKSDEGPTQLLAELAALGKVATNSAFGPVPRPPIFLLELQPSVLGWNRVTFGEDVLPAPSRVICRYILRRIYPPTTAKRFADVFGLAASARTWWSDDVELQATAVTRTGVDGASEILLHVAPATRPQTLINQGGIHEPLANADDHSPGPVRFVQVSQVISWSGPGEVGIGIGTLPKLPNGVAIYVPAPPAGEAAQQRLAPDESPGSAAGSRR